MTLLALNDVRKKYDERMILDGNAFVERVLPGSILRTLSEEEMAVYRAPFPSPQSRRPALPCSAPLPRRSS